VRNKANSAEAAGRASTWCKRVYGELNMHETSAKQSQFCQSRAIPGWAGTHLCETKPIPGGAGWDEAWGTGAVGVVQTKPICLASAARATAGRAAIAVAAEDNHAKQTQFGQRYAKGKFFMDKEL
jgi:hypothetical protein